MWSTASIDGASASPVLSEAPSVRSGWITVGAQSTRGLPVVSPRTTVSSEEYDQGLDFPWKETVAFTVYGTFAPTAGPGVITALVTWALSR